MNAKEGYGGMSLYGKPDEKCGRDNPDEYGEIVEENFAIAYPEKFRRNFRDYSP